MAQSPGAYKGIPIKAGTDAEIQAQIRAIDAGQTSAPPVKITATTVLTQEQLDALNKSYADALKTHALAATNTPETILNSYLTGDWSGVSDSTGKPFSLADQQAALASSEAALKPYYEAQTQKDTQDAEALMKQKQLDYQNYLDTQATKFQEDKTTLDQSAANQGVLFSGGRTQKERSLQGAYEKAQAYKQASTGADIASVARDFAYKQGSPAAGGLSQYYNLGGQNYNPGVATGGVTPGGLSSVYNAGGYPFQGTSVVTAKAEAQKRAAGMLWNKGNKLLSTGYTNQY